MQLYSLHIIEIYRNVLMCIEKVFPFAVFFLHYFISKNMVEGIDYKFKWVKKFCFVRCKLHSFRYWETRLLRKKGRTKVNYAIKCKDVSVITLSEEKKNVKMDVLNFFSSTSFEGECYWIFFIIFNVFQGILKFQCNKK